MNPRRWLASFAGWIAKRLFRLANKIVPEGDYLIIGKDGTRIELREGLQMKGSITLTNSIHGPRTVSGSVSFTSKANDGTHIDMADTSLETSREEP